MNSNDDQSFERKFGRLLPSIGVLAFGLLALAFLVAIERPHWFSVRSASGTAQAMAYAAEAPPAPGQPRASMR